MNPFTISLTQMKYVVVGSTIINTLVLIIVLYLFVRVYGLLRHKYFRYHREQILPNNIKLEAVSFVIMVKVNGVWMNIVEAETLPDITHGGQTDAGKTVQEQDDICA